MDDDRAVPLLQRRFTFPWRVLFYLIPWLGAPVVFFICLFPEPTENADSPWGQALVLPLQTPLMVIAGLAYGILGEDCGQLVAWLVALGFLAHAGFALSRRSVAALISLFVLQVILVGIGVGGLLHFVATLPSD